MRPILIALLSFSVALAGCAKKTRDVQASYVPTTKYDAYLCSQLRDEASRVSQRATAVFGEQNMKASIGAVIYWPTSVVSRTAGASDEEVARLKGEMIAIEQNSNARNCGIQFQHAGAAGDDLAAPRYDAGGVKPDARSNSSNSIYNVPPTTLLR